MKKVLALALLAVLCVTSCTRSQGNNSGGLPKIGVAIYKFDDTFMSYTRNAIEKAGKDKARVEVVDSQNAQPIQNDQIDAFLSKQMDAIAVNPVDRTAAAAIINNARAKNTPLVFFNREPLPEDMNSWDRVYYVGAKAEESGTMQGQIVAAYWKSHPEADKNRDGVLQYIMLKGEPGHQDAELRTEYSVKAVQAAGIKVERLAEDTAMWDRPRAVEKMDAFYARFGDRIEVVFCNNDDMALGAIESLRKAGYFSNNKYIPVVGVDATAPALQALAQGTLLGTVLNDAQNQGKATFDLAYALASGAGPDSTDWPLVGGKYIWVPYQKVTKDNYTQFQ
ncbi:MAG: galactose/glucose ABC transporter substrate-binding protein MglB [Spirochaetaceae bacterium]|jgi:methyl-galactoside transport system substrate-binding protein|nr:galactose/glucose ABC transporter substrate-binding protein MglB [Spirochaetaceae bacterium]